MDNVPSKSLLSVRGIKGRVSSKKKFCAENFKKIGNNILYEHRIYLDTQITAMEKPRASRPHSLSYARW